MLSKKTRRLVYGVYPRILPNTPLVTAGKKHASCCEETSDEEVDYDKE